MISRLWRWIWTRVPTVSQRSLRSAEAQWRTRVHAVRPPGILYIAGDDRNQDPTALFIPNDNYWIH